MLGEKTTAVMHRLFVRVSLCMLADVIGDVSACAKCTWLTTSAKHSKVLQILVDHPQFAPVCVVGWSWPKQMNNRVLCLCRGCSLSFEPKLAKFSWSMGFLLGVIFRLFFGWFCWPWFIYPFILFFAADSVDSIYNLRYSNILWLQLTVEKTFVNHRMEVETRSQRLSN